MDLMSEIRPSSRPAGRGITIGTPDRYEALADAVFEGRREAIFGALATEAGFRRGDRVLDVGAGTGYLARIVAAAVGESGAVVGLDAAPEMVAYARDRARGASHCTFQAGSADALPFPDADFDAVVSTFVIHHLPEDARLAAMREIGRVLRPRGRVLIAEVPVDDPMSHGVASLATLVAEAGCGDVRTGDIPPHVRWASGVRAPATAA